MPNLLFLLGSMLGTAVVATNTHDNKNMAHHESDISYEISQETRVEMMEKAVAGLDNFGNGTTTNWQSLFAYLDQDHNKALSLKEVGLNGNSSGELDDIRNGFMKLDADHSEDISIDEFEKIGSIDAGALADYARQGLQQMQKSQNALIERAHAISNQDSSSVEQSVSSKGSPAPPPPSCNCQGINDVRYRYWQCNTGHNGNCDEGSICTRNGFWGPGAACSGAICGHTAGYYTVAPNGCSWCTGGATRRRRTYSCENCPVSYKKTNNNQDDCEACVGGSTRRRNTQQYTTCVDCKAGYYNDGNSDDCKQCSNGFVRRRSIGRWTACKTCPSGWYDDKDADDCTARFTIKTNLLPEKMKWTITQGNVLICSGGPYRDWYSTAVIIPECNLIVNSKYTLTCKDAYGEGWGGGSIKIGENTYCEQYAWGQGSEFVVNYTHGA